MLSIRLKSLIPAQARIQAERGAALSELDPMC